MHEWTRHSSWHCSDVKRGTSQGEREDIWTFKDHDDEDKERKDNRQGRRIQVYHIPHKTERWSRMKKKEHYNRSNVQDISSRRFCSTRMMNGLLHDGCFLISHLRLHLIWRRRGSCLPFKLMIVSSRGRLCCVCLFNETSDVWGEYHLLSLLVSSCQLSILVMLLSFPFYVHFKFGCHYYSDYFISISFTSLPFSSSSSMCLWDTQLAHYFPSQWTSTTVKDSCRQSMRQVSSSGFMPETKGWGNEAGRCSFTWLLRR